MFKKIILTILLTISVNAFSHEGHDSTPGSLKTNHGGVVQAGKVFNLEYVVVGSEVKLYPASHEGVDLSVNEVTVAVTSKLPKGKATVLKTDVINSAFVTKVDFQKAYRLEINVDASFKNQKSSFKFQVEK